MGIKYGWTKGDHIQPGIFFQKQTTFQTGMNGFYSRFNTKQPFIAVNSNSSGSPNAGFGFQPG